MSVVPASIRLTRADNKKLDPDQTSQALRFTTMQPQERLKAISKAVTSLCYRDNELCVRSPPSR